MVADVRRRGPAQRPVRVVPGGQVQRHAGPDGHQLRRGGDVRPARRDRERVRRPGPFRGTANTPTRSWPPTRTAPRPRPSRRPRTSSATGIRLAHLDVVAVAGRKGAGKGVHLLLRPPHAAVPRRRQPRGGIGLRVRQPRLLGQPARHRRFEDVRIDAGLLGQLRAVRRPERRACRTGRTSLRQSSGSCWWT